MFVLDNVTDNELVYQRALLITGRYTGDARDAGDAGNTGDADSSHVLGHVSVSVASEAGRALFDDCPWPSCDGFFRALVMLSPGANKVTIRSGSNAEHAITTTVSYTPLLQNPPLHLAILVARDSPLLIDCPPAKHAGISSTHASVDAAVAKLRMTAYMWQAVTAEDMRAKGLGRRSFRLEEEWAVETLSSRLSSSMQTTAKVHMIRCDKTVEELRDPDLAQQNANASRRDELHDIFTRALKQHGAPFVDQARPVVAGLILDAHYDGAKDMILAHAALGACSPGLSLGVFGSHLTYSWPRFVEEIPACLLDMAPPGATVANDNNECATMWEACAVGQGAFLHELGHAFGAPHSTGIMQRGYSPDWARWFLSATAPCAHKNQPAIRPVTRQTPNDCAWDIRDAVSFANKAHFALPGDEPLPGGPVQFELQGLDEEEDETASPDSDAAGGGSNSSGTSTAQPHQVSVVISSPAGIAFLWLNGELQDGVVSLAAPKPEIVFSQSYLEARFDASKPLECEAIARNGRSHKQDLWKLLRDGMRLTVRIPGSRIRLKKQSVRSADGADKEWHWAVMLRKRRNGRPGAPLVDATMIDLRVGCVLDGAIVYYDDGKSVPCGPRTGASDDDDDHDHGMGGHQARKLALPRGVDIAQVVVNRVPGVHDLFGLRMWLANGKAMGALNRRPDDDDPQVLRPAPNDRIVGFYGRSGRWGMCCEFGIITAPRGADIPDSAYDLPELQNTDGRAPGDNPMDGDRDEEEEETHYQPAEDEDDGYDNPDDRNDDFQDVAGSAKR